MPGRSSLMLQSPPSLSVPDTRSGGIRIEAALIRWTVHLEWIHHESDVLSVMTWAVNVTGAALLNSCVDDERHRAEPREILAGTWSAAGITVKKVTRRVKRGYLIRVAARISLVSVKGQSV